MLIGPRGKFGGPGLPIANPPKQSRFSILFGKKILKGGMIRMHYAFVHNQIRPEFFKCIHYCQHLFFCCSVISFRIVHRLTSIVNRLEVFLMSLPQDHTYGKIACVTHKLKWQVPVWGNQDWSFRKFFLQCLESFDTLFREKDRSILLKKMSHRSGDFRKILSESPVKTGVTEETSNTLDGRGMRQFSNDIDFGSVDLNLVFGNLMAEDNALFDHKVAFLPV
nr:hypothetical protein [Tanacetum cinerariifolium]